MNLSVKNTSQSKLTVLPGNKNVISRPVVKSLPAYKKVRITERPSMPPEQHGYIKARRHDFL